LSPYTGGKELQNPPAPLTGIVNPANQNLLAKIFKAQEERRRGGQRRG
jgi:hypothetical protein